MRDQDSTQCHLCCCSDEVLEQKAGVVAIDQLIDLKVLSVNPKSLGDVHSESSWPARHF